jgi:hypothetical protein
MSIEYVLFENNTLFVEQQLNMTCHGMIFIKTVLYNRAALRYVRSYSTVHQESTSERRAIVCGGASQSLILHGHHDGWLSVTLLFY